VDDPCFGKLARAHAFGGDQPLAFRTIAIGGPENIDVNQELHCRQLSGSCRVAVFQCSSLCCAVAAHKRLR